MVDHHKRTYFKIASTAGIGLSLTSAYLFWFDSGSQAKELDPLQAIIDTLIPADETAGALNLNLDSKFYLYRKTHTTWEARAKRLANLSEALALDTHQLPFPALSLKAREALLTSSLNDPQKVQFRMDLYALRNLIFRWYYLTKTGRQSLGYRLPSEYPAYSQSDIKIPPHEL